MNSRPTSGFRRSLCALFLSAVAWVAFATPRAGAQGHVHHWTAGTEPDSSALAFHLDGTPVSPEFPAAPCEVLYTSLFWAPHDDDVCDADGCPAPLATDLGVWLRRQRRKPEHPYAFGAMTPYGYFERNETEEEMLVGGVTSTWLVSGLNTLRISRHAASQSWAAVDIECDDTGFGDNGEGQQPTYNDPPAWSTAAGLWIDGDACAIQTWREVDPSQLTFCDDGARQPGNSSIMPLTGDVEFSVPITSWGYRGESLGLALTYHSLSVVEPDLRTAPVPHPAALSDKVNVQPGTYGHPRVALTASRYNPKWTHTFAQWCEIDAGGWVVWNRGDGSRMAFEQYWENGQGPFFRAKDGYHSLTASGGWMNSPTFRYDDEPTFASVSFKKLELTDGDGVTYTFGSTTGAGVRWNIAETPGSGYFQSPGNHCGYAIPYFLLTRITDRFGREVDVTWNDNGVTQVRDGAGRGLDFTYNADRLISSVTDPAGRTHTFGYTTAPVPGGVQPKLTSVSVQGVGTPRTSYAWTFGYSDSGGYLGAPTNDLVTHKVEPSGNLVHYAYEAVDGQGVVYADYDGRLARTWFLDDLTNPPVTREILRSGTTLTYPGGDSYAFTFDGHHLASRTHVNTGAAVYYSWDAEHNLSGVRTGMEFQPLVALDYTYGGPSGKQILAVTATDLGGGSATAQFNALNLPTEVRAHGQGMLPDQVTRFVYDGGGPLGVGKLTRLIAAWGSPAEDTTDFEYGSPMFPDLPTAVADSTGGVSTAGYGHPDGTPVQTSGPANLLRPPGDPDRAPSVTWAEQDADELPSAMVDALGHRTEFSYAAESPGSSRLVVTLRHVADNSTTSMTLDADGQVVRSVDENGVVSTTDYNRAGQPLRLKEAVGTAQERETRCYYDAHGDLSAFDPPSGAAGRVTLEYVRYHQPWFPGQSPQKAVPEVYEGQVTRVVYPDGTSEYCGYNGAEELQWSLNRAGALTTLDRDSLHRVYRVNYPATPDYPAFSVDCQYDVLGRVTQTQDQIGVSTFSYDELNRLVTATPAAGQGIAYSHQRDLANHRWIHRVTLSGAGTGSSGRTARAAPPPRSTPSARP